MDDYKFGQSDDPGSGGTLEQIANRIDKLMDGFTPVYRKIGVDRVMRISERVLGSLDDSSRAYVATGHLFATANLAAGIVTGQPILYVLAGTCYGISLLHHGAMSRHRRDAE